MEFGNKGKKAVGFKERQKEMPWNLIRPKTVILSVCACLLFSGCASGRTEDVPYSEASCQVLMHGPGDSGYHTEDMKNVR